MKGIKGPRRRFSQVEQPPVNKENQQKPLAMSVWLFVQPVTFVPTYPCQAGPLKEADEATFVFLFPRRDLLIINDTLKC